MIEMNFKTKEKLKQKTDKEVYWYFNGIDDAFESFAERVEFYKKYVDDTKLFCNEQTNILKEEHLLDSDIEMMMASEYRDWLFNYCFGDVIL
jgi:hypothetical protein